MNHDDTLRNQLALQSPAHIAAARRAISNFTVRVSNYVIEHQKVQIQELFGRYIQMQPAIHPLAGRHAIDLPAIVYALQRSPRRIVQARQIQIMKETRHHEYSQRTPLETFLPGIRRRTMYELGQHDLEEIARDMDTDILDITTCTIMYALEADKIKTHLSRDNRLVKELQEYNTADEVRRSTLRQRAANTLGVSVAALEGADQALNGEFIQLLPAIAKHKATDLTLMFDEAFQLSDESEKVKLWRSNLETHLKPYDGRPIAFISSDSHSVVNVLSGFAQDHADVIKEHASQHPVLHKLSLNEPGLLYYALCALSRRGAPLHMQKIEHEEKLGFRYIKDVNHTGVDVQVIDMKELISKRKMFDSRLDINAAHICKEGLVLVNMDYSFGQQGFYMLNEFINAVTPRITDIGITGKAGIVAPGGGKYDIMLPEYVIQQITQNAFNLGTGNKLTENALRAVGFKQQIFHDGALLSVPGTALQNLAMYQYHMVRDRMIGCEMESAPYLHAVELAMMRRNAHGDFRINPHARLHVGHWASDVPLDPNQTLAQSHLEAGSIPQYALICAIINNICNGRR